MRFLRPILASVGVAAVAGFYIGVHQVLRSQAYEGHVHDVAVFGDLEARSGIRFPKGSRLIAYTEGGHDAPNDYGSYAIMSEEEIQIPFPKRHEKRPGSEGAELMSWRFGNNLVIEDPSWTLAYSMGRYRFRCIWGHCGSHWYLDVSQSSE